MESEFTENLEEALNVHFEPLEARCLGILLSCFVGCEIISYKEIPMKGEAKNETILLAYDERAIIPCSGGKGAEWQTRSLSCMPEEAYFMPRISRRLVVDASMTGRFDSMDSMQRLWEDVYPEDAETAIELFSTLMKHTRNTILEAGLIAAIARSIRFSKDLHDIVDAAGLLGIISPHSRATTVQGLSWYQINPTLFWEQGKK